MDYSNGLDLINNALCYKCQVRQGIISNTTSTNCYICNGILERLDEFYELIKYALKDYEFKTFLIGATVPLDIIEREDEFRSKFKIKGRSIKNEITTTLSKIISTNMNVKHSFTDPDIIINIDLRGKFVNVRSKSICLLGRYKKSKRGIEQKSSKCNNCNGRGCHICNFKGVLNTSIEDIISKRLLMVYNADKIRFFWIGSEDKNSLVLNNGRPFFVKIINPRKRDINYKNIKINEDAIEAIFLKRVSGFPSRDIKFRSRFKILVYSHNKININSISLNSITIKRENKSVKKNIYKFDTKLIDDNTLEIDMIVDSGFPVKKFINGDDIEPNLAKLLNTDLECKYFDLLDIIIDKSIQIVN